jgi:hypothetical protein
MFRYFSGLRQPTQAAERQNSNVSIRLVYVYMSTPNSQLSKYIFIYIYRNSSNRRTCPSIFQSLSKVPVYTYNKRLPVNWMLSMSAMSVY